jgi:hypothetical protein
MNGRWLTAIAWIAFFVVLGTVAELMLTACDIGSHPLFAGRYCRAQTASPLLTEQERERDLLDRLHQAQLAINRLPVCLPDPPVHRTEMVPPPPTPTPDERLTIPHNVNDLNGCWQSIQGDIPAIAVDDESHRVVGHKRICYCFSGNGGGEVRHIFLEGGRCFGPLQIRLSGERLIISHGQIPCANMPPPSNSIVATDVTCTKKADDGTVSCDRVSRGKFPVAIRGEIYHRVSAENCN